MTVPRLSPTGVELSFESVTSAQVPQTFGPGDGVVTIVQTAPFEADDTATVVSVSGRLRVSASGVNGRLGLSLETTVDGVDYVLAVRAGVLELPIRVSPVDLPLPVIWGVMPPGATQLVIRAFAQVVDITLAADLGPSFTLHRL